MRTRTIAGAIAALAVVAAACGDDEQADPVAAPATTTASTEAPDPTAVPDPTVATTAAPAAVAPETPEVLEANDIISLSPTATEMLYAMGAEHHVLAVDDFSNYPPEAAEKMQGLSGFEPNVEAIAGLDPDLVVTDGTNPDLLAQLDSLDIPHWEGPAATSFDDVYAQIEELGVVSGHPEQALELVAQMRLEVDAVIAELPELDEPMTYYHELDPTYFSVTSGTFIGAVYEEIGLVNIADAAGDGSPYPQLNAEFIIAENPDLIFLACTKYCGETAETVAARPGWSDLDALSTGGVIEMDDDIASRWGPRIIEYLQVAGAAVGEVAALQATG